MGSEKEEGEIVFEPWEGKIGGRLIQIGGLYHAAKPPPSGITENKQNNREQGEQANNK